MYRYKNTLFFTNTKTFFYIIDFYINKNNFFSNRGEIFYVFFHFFSEKQPIRWAFRLSFVHSDLQSEFWSIRIFFSDYKSLYSFRRTGLQILRDENFTTTSISRQR
jgi:hypothetical protein